MESTYTTRGLVIICVGIAMAAFIGGYYIRDNKSDDEEAAQTASPRPSVVVSATPTPTTAYKPSSYTVKLTTAGLSPKLLQIRVGDTVTLLNDSSTAFWPASDPHPTHTQCLGFDAKRGLNRGESYTLTFTKVQTCGYHNHLDPANTTMRGTITVR